MDEISRNLLDNLRKIPREDLDEDQLETLNYLEEVESADQEKPAAIHEAVQVGKEGEIAHRRPECPKCGSGNYRGLNTAKGLMMTCKDCHHRWKGGGITPFWAPGHGPGVPRQGPFVTPGGKPAAGAPPKQYFKDPRKAK